MKIDWAEEGCRGADADTGCAYGSAACSTLSVCDCKCVYKCASAALCCFHGLTPVQGCGPCLSCTLCIARHLLRLAAPCCWCCCSAATAQQGVWLAWRVPWQRPVVCLC